jgi:DNA polymerase
MTNKLEALTKEILVCEDCHLKLGRTQVVPGIYGPKKSICFVGEAPGYYEDQQGFPFVGKSGELLDNMLKGIGLAREKDVSILNVIKCRPTTENGQNRTPTDSELRFCGERWLHNQLSILSPKLVVALGGIALKFFIPKGRVTQLAGQLVKFDESNYIFVTYHPAYILRKKTLEMMEEYNSHFEQILNLYQKETSDQEYEQATGKDEQSSKKANQKSLKDFF